MLPNISTNLKVKPIFSCVICDSTPRYVGRLVSQLVGWSVGRLVAWSVAQLVSWSVGWSDPFLLFWHLLAAQMPW